jgi:hypothetical protein
MFPWVTANYSGISHPMWILIPLMVASLMIYSKFYAKQLLADFHWTVWDTLLLSFVGIVAINLIFSEIGDKERIVRYLFSIMLFPYFFSRTISRDGIKIFVHTTLIFSYGFTIVTLISIAYLGSAAYHQERLYLYSAFPAGPGIRDFPAHQAFPMGIALLVIFLVSSLMLENQDNPKSNRNMLIMLFVAMLTMIFLGSRAVLTACLFVSVATVLLARWKDFKTKRLCLLVITCAVALALAIVPQDKRGFIGQLLNVKEAADAASNVVPNVVPHAVPNAASNAVPSQSDDCNTPNNSMSNRIILHREAIAAFLQNPIVGVGVGRFGYYSCFYGFRGELNSPHSTVLHALVELGLIGGGVFLWLMVGLIIWLLPQMTKRPNFDNRWVYILSPMFLFSAILDQISSSYITSVHYYLLAGILVKLTLLSQKPPLLKVEKSVNERGVT